MEQSADEVGTVRRGLSLSLEIGRHARQAAELAGASSRVSLGLLSLQVAPGWRTWAQGESQQRVRAEEKPHSRHAPLWGPAPPALHAGNPPPV